MRPREIEVVVDELVIRGLHASPGRSIADAMETQLAQELRSGVALSLQSREYADAGAIEMPLDAGPPAMGLAISRAVGRALR